MKILNRKPHEGDAAKQVAQRRHTKPTCMKVMQQIKPHQGHPKMQTFTEPENK
jgi:hypothetical protein